MWRTKKCFLSNVILINLVFFKLSATYSTYFFSSIISFNNTWNAFFPRSLSHLIRCTTLFFLLLCSNRYLFDLCLYILFPIFLITIYLWNVYNLHFVLREEVKLGLHFISKQTVSRTFIISIALMSLIMLKRIFFFFLDVWCHTLTHDKPSFIFIYKYDPLHRICYKKKLQIFLIKFFFLWRRKPSRARIYENVRWKKKTKKKTNRKLVRRIGNVRRLFYLPGYVIFTTNLRLNIIQTKEFQDVKNKNQKFYL